MEKTCDLAGILTPCQKLTNGHFLDLWRKNSYQAGMFYSPWQIV